MAEERVEESAREDPAMPQEAELNLARAIGDFIHAAIEVQGRKRLDIRWRNIYHRKFEELAFAIRQYGAWLVSEDGRTTMGVWKTVVEAKARGPE